MNKSEIEDYLLEEARERYFEREDEVLGILAEQSKSQVGSWD